MKNNKYFKKSDILKIIIIAIFLTLNLIAENINIMFSSYIKLSITFIPTIISSYMLNYKNILILFVCNSIIFFFRSIKHGIFGLLFNISHFLSINIYYIFFNIINKRESISFFKCFIVKFIINIFINVLLNTYFISLIYGKSIFLLFPIRLLKNIILLPIEALIIFFVLNKINHIIKIHKNISL